MSELNSILIVLHLRHGAGELHGDRDETAINLKLTHLSQCWNGRNESLISELYSISNCYDMADVTRQ